MYEKNKISQILNDRKMTYRELSRLSGVSFAALCYIANFQREPTQSTMVAIARALNMETTEVFNLDWRHEHE